MNLGGSLAAWVQKQKQACGGKFEPTEIQEQCMLRIYEGECVAMKSPTGTGKTLAFLLPLLQRLDDQPKAESRHRSNLRMLVLVPSVELQLQMASLIRSLVGPSRALSVTALRMDVDSTTMSSGNTLIVPHVIAVATPRQIKLTLEHPLRGPVWRQALAQIDVVVVDEADRLVHDPERLMRNKKLRQMGKEPEQDIAVTLLENIRDWCYRAKRGDHWQLVAASATLGRKTRRKLMHPSGIDLSFVKVAGYYADESSTFFQREKERLDMLEKLGKVENAGLPELDMPMPDDLIHTTRVLREMKFREVVKTVLTTILDVGARRTLVAVSPNDTFDPRKFTIPAITGFMRYRLETKGYKVTELSEAVQAAAECWADGLGEQSFWDGPRASMDEVIVGKAEGLRGVHLDGVEAIVMIGNPIHLIDYVHLAGRTGRHIPGQEEVCGGLVVSITVDQQANRIFMWSELQGFELYEVPREKAHPSLEDCLSRRAFAAVSDDAEGEGAGAGTGEGRGEGADPEAQAPGAAPADDEGGEEAERQRALALARDSRWDQEEVFFEVGGERDEEEGGAPSESEPRSRPVRALKPKRRRRMTEDQLRAEIERKNTEFERKFGKRSAETDEASIAERGVWS